MLPDTSLIASGRIMERVLRLFLLIFSICGYAASAQTVEHTYRFYETLQVGAPECVPDLAPIRSVSTCNAGLSPGNYPEDTPPCRVTRKVYHTNASWGLGYANTQGIVSDSYTISMYVKITSWGESDKVPVLNFPDSSGEGIHFLKANGSNEYCLSIPGAGVIGECPFFKTNNYYLLTFARDGQSGLLSVYVNNALFTTFNDRAGDYVGSAGKSVHVFHNGDTNSCSSAEANFAYLSFSNIAVSAQQVSDNFGTLCFTANINSAADFQIDPNPSCGFPKNITIAYTGSISANNSAYSFAWDWDGGNVVSGSDRGPFVVNWSNPGPKNVTLTITRLECNNKITNTKTAEINSLDLLWEVIPPSCADPLATVSLEVVDGKAPFQYSADSVNFQAAPIFKLPAASYRMFVKDASNCIIGKEVTIEPAQSIQVETIGDTTICEGQSVSLITSSNSEVLNWLPTSGLDNPAARDPVATPIVTTTYVVTAGELGCVNRDTITVRVVPKIEIAVTPDSDIEESIPFQLEARSAQLDNIPGSKYSWFPPTGLNNTGIPNPVATVLSSNTYTVRGTTPEGCSAEASVTLTVIPPDWIYVPTAFSPNRDGKNDVLYLNVKGVKEFSYWRIYNRWGQLVFQTNDISAGWDGRFQGNEPIGGVYTFQLLGTTERGKIIHQEGSILLLR
jgi:gliding motility-associated-like protein